MGWTAVGRSPASALCPHGALGGYRLSPRVFITPIFRLHWLADRDSTERGVGPFITRLDSPGNWTIESDWFRLASQIRFASVGERLFQATIPDASPGEHWIRFVDTNLCLGKDPNDPTEPFDVRGVHKRRRPDPRAFLGRARLRTSSTRHRVHSLGRWCGATVRSLLFCPNTPAFERFGDPAGKRSFRHLRCFGRESATLNTRGTFHKTSNPGGDSNLVTWTPRGFDLRCCAEDFSRKSSNGGEKSSLHNSQEFPRKPWD